MATYQINDEGEEFIAGDLEARARHQSMGVYLQEFIPWLGLWYYHQRIIASGKDPAEDIVGFRENAYFLLQHGYHIAPVIFPIASLIEYLNGKLT